MKKIEVIVEKVKREITIEVNPVGLQGPKMEFSDLTEAEKDSLSLKWEHLTPEQVDELRLKFEHLTPEQKAEIKGDALKFEDLTEAQKEEIFTKYMSNYAARW